jgi:predicted RNase H-like nuclease
VHPELSFWEMAGGRAAKHGKKSAAGRTERTRLLSHAGFNVPVTPPSGAAMDDVLDALAACWTAQRIRDGEAICVPAKPRRDRHHLRMAVWR